MERKRKLSSYSVRNPTLYKTRSACLHVYPRNFNCRFKASTAVPCSRPVISPIVLVIKRIGGGGDGNNSPRVTSIDRPLLIDMPILA